MDSARGKHEILRERLFRPDGSEGDAGLVPARQNVLFRPPVNADFLKVPVRRQGDPDHFAEPELAQVEDLAERHGCIVSLGAIYAGTTQDPGQGVATPDPELANRGLVRRRQQCGNGGSRLRAGTGLVRLDSGAGCCGKRASRQQDRENASNGDRRAHKMAGRRAHGARSRKSGLPVPDNVVHQLFCLVFWIIRGKLDDAGTQDIRRNVKSNRIRMKTGNNRVTSAPWSEARPESRPPGPDVPSPRPCIEPCPCRQ